MNGVKGISQHQTTLTPEFVWPVGSLASPEPGAVRGLTTTSSPRASTPVRDDQPVPAGWPPTLAQVPEAELRTRYTTGWTVRHLASAYKCALSQVVEALDYYQIPRRPPRASWTAAGIDADTIADILCSYRAGHTIRAIAHRLRVARAPVREIVDEAGITRPLRRVSESGITVGQLQLEYEAGASLPELSETYDLILSSLRNELRRVGTQFRALRDTSGRVSQNRRPQSPVVEALRAALRQLRTNAGSPGRKNLSDQVAATAARLRTRAPSRNTVANAFDGTYLPARNTVRLIAVSLGGDEADFDTQWLVARAEYFPLETTAAHGESSKLT